MATEAERTVFISYRRSVSGFFALAVFKDLHEHGYDVFMDVMKPSAGPLTATIMNQIAARAYFIVILTPGSVERCEEPGDWLRREIEFAMDLGRNIIPLLAHDFSFEDSEQYLTGRLSRLSEYAGFSVPYEFFDAAMDRLRAAISEQPVGGDIRPAPAGEQAAVQEKIEAAASQSAPTGVQLTAEQWFERGFARAKSDLDGKISDCTEAIRLNPQYAAAYYGRGLARKKQGDLAGAIADLTEAIRLDPTDAAAYNRRGGARYHQGDLAGAIADYNEAIRLDSQNASGFNNRGEAEFALGQMQLALPDFARAYDLRLAYKWAIAGLAITLHALGRVEEALQRWQSLVEEDARYRDADWVGEKLSWRPELVEEARKLISKL